MHIPICMIVVMLGGSVPVIFKKNNIKFCVYAKDHNPPHVHVTSPGATLVVDLITFEVIASSGFRMNQIQTLVETIKQKQNLLITEWNKYHA